MALVGCWSSLDWSSPWIGLIWVLAPNLPRLGRLPGDIVIERENSRFYFPIVTCIVISVWCRAAVGPTVQ